jgi:hypothetical protein
MAARCTKHSFEVAVAQCRSCGEPFCDDCLVYTYGPSSPPFCVPCALVAAGVRRVSGAEKKAMKAARHKKVELDPTARSPMTMSVGYDGSDVDDAPAPSPVTSDDEDVVVGAGADTGSSRFSLAWIAVAVGLLLLLVPLVAGNV